MVPVTSVSMPGILLMRNGLKSVMISMAKQLVITVDLQQHYLMMD